MARSAQTIPTGGLTTIALIAFAGNSILCRLALGESAMDPVGYTAVRLISGAVTLWMICAFIGSKSPQYAGSWTGAAMLFVYAATFSFAYVSLSTGSGALILFASVQITMLGVGLYLGERPAMLEWLGSLIALGGLAYLVSPGISAPTPGGALMMAIAGVAWGLYSIKGRGAENPVLATSGNFTRTVPFALLLVLVFLPGLSISSTGLLWAVVSGSITSGMGYVIWYTALRNLSGARASTVQLLVPVIAALGGVVFLAEEVTWRLSMAAVVILSGVGLGIFAKGKRQQIYCPGGDSVGFFSDRRDASLRNYPQGAKAS